jgi:hypothetical protein
MPEVLAAEEAAATTKMLRRITIISAAVMTTAKVAAVEGDLVLITRTIIGRKFIMKIDSIMIMIITEMRKRAVLDLEGPHDLAVSNTNLKILTTYKLSLFIKSQKRKGNQLCKSWLKSVRNYTKKDRNITVWEILSIADMLKRNLMRKLNMKSRREIMVGVANLVDLALIVQPVIIKNIILVIIILISIIQEAMTSIMKTITMIKFIIIQATRSTRITPIPKTYIIQTVKANILALLIIWMT